MGKTFKPQNGNNNRNNNNRQGGNNNHNNNRQQQKPPVYRGKNVDMMGDPGRMERHATDIFRDMSRGKYNAANISEFANREFLMACISACEKNMKKHDILRTALEFTYPNCNDIDVTQLKNAELYAYNGWRYVFESIYRFINTNDFGVIVGMITYLSTNKDLRL